MEITIEQRRQFYECLSILDNIPDINQGGCGISALSMYRWLEKRGYLKGDEHFKFLYRGNDGFYKNNQKALQNNEETHFCSCSHVLFYFDGHYYDSNGKQKVTIGLKNCDYKTSHTLSYYQLIDAINNKGTWNREFSREMCVPVIEEHLGIDLEDIHPKDLRKESWISEIIFESFMNFIDGVLDFQ